MRSWVLLVLGMVALVLYGCAGVDPSPPPAATVSPTRPSLPASATPTEPVLPTRTPSDTLTPSPTATPTATPSPSATPSATPTPTPSYTPTPEPTITPSTSSLQIPELHPRPGDPIPYLETFRLLTYYGSPTGWGLGILGESPREVMGSDLKWRALQLQALSPEHFVLPTFHMVTTVADPFPGEDEDYNHRFPEEGVDEWLTYAGENGFAVVLDIQPARASLQEEFDRVKSFLELPHVHLAIDPEFLMNEYQIPGQHLGHITAEQINDIQAQLNEIALRIGINRVLIIHQFEDMMLENKEALIDYPHVELVIDADGTSVKWLKLYDYEQYIDEPGFEYGGIKIFLKIDREPLLTLEELVALEPPPAVIIYQ